MEDEINKKYIDVEEVDFRTDLLKIGKDDIFDGIEASTMELLKEYEKARLALHELVSTSNMVSDGLDDHEVLQISKKLNKKLDGEIKSFMSSGEDDVSLLILGIEEAFQKSIEIKPEKKRSFFKKMMRMNKK